MKKRTLRLKTLGLCLLSALSLMAVSATPVQAEGHWFVTLTHTLEVAAAEEGNDFSLLSTFGASETPIQILCTKVKVDDGLLFENGSGSGELLFSSCQTVISKLVKANCKALEPIAVKVKNLLVHHKEDTYILFSPHTGLVFTTLHLGELCAAGENVEVTGHAMAECGSLLEALWHHEDCSTEKIEHEFQPAPAELFPEHVLKFGSKKATTDGDARLSLTGLYAGMKWGALATL